MQPAVIEKHLPLPAYAVVERELAAGAGVRAASIRRIVVSTDSSGTSDTVSLFDAQGANLGSFSVVHPANTPDSVGSYVPDASVTLDPGDIEAIQRVRDFRARYRLDDRPFANEEHNGTAVFIRRRAAVSVTLVEALGPIPPRTFVLRCPIGEGYRIEPSSVTPFNACFVSPKYLRDLPFSPR